MIKCREVEQNIRKDKKWSTSYLLIGTEKSFFYLSFRNFNKSIKYSTHWIAIEFLRSQQTIKLN